MFIEKEGSVIEETKPPLHEKEENMDTSDCCTDYYYRRQWGFVELSR